MLCHSPIQYRVKRPERHFENQHYVLYLFELTLSNFQEQFKNKYVLTEEISAFPRRIPCGKAVEFPWVLWGRQVEKIRLQIKQKGASAASMLAPFRFILRLCPQCQPWA